MENQCKDPSAEFATRGEQAFRLECFCFWLIGYTDGRIAGPWSPCEVAQ